MGATGTATLDFGSFPGKSDASVTVTGQTSIASGSLVEAWIRPVATSDHSADEHMLETIKVFAHTIVAGTGFTISGFNTSEINEPLRQPRGAPYTVAGATGGLNNVYELGGKGTRIYGQWTIAWVWN